MPHQEEKAILTGRLAEQVQIFDAEFADVELLDGDRTAAREFADALRRMIEREEGDSARIIDADVPHVRAFYEDAALDALRAKDWRMLAFYATRLCDGA